MEYQQLSLNIQLRDNASFANFYATSNEPLLHFLKNIFTHTESFYFIWGAPGAGKTHLLQAACQQAQTQQHAAMYIPLKECHRFSPAIVENIENLALICIDDLEQITNQVEWQQALFHAYNRMQLQHTRCIFAANAPPQALALPLADLQSRLSACAIFQLHALNDSEKLAALQLRAQQRGFALPDNVAEFLLHHYSRDNNDLFQALEKLDKASLAAQRKLTIPFVKTVLAA